MTDHLILTHGAGSNRDAPLLLALADAFTAKGWSVSRSNLAFREQRPKGPPPRGSAERDQQGLRDLVQSLRQQTTGRVFLGGHSYGGRQASMLAAQEPGLVEALLLLSYPLHPPQQPTQLRTAHFPHLQTPALFVQGTRDGFASPEEMDLALHSIPAKVELLTIAGAGHDLLTRRNRDQESQRVADRFQTFVATFAATPYRTLHPNR